ncbi:MAG: branched-chain-amino-acid transaminase [Spirochaetes bacterium]|nr:branched-chain-amino-acid transaminase [Spirochaetota bacterium]
MGTPEIYINGTYYSRETAMISVYDHGLLYGDGVFEGIRIYGGRIFRLREHLERLYDSAAAIHLAVPLTPEAMEAAVLEAVRRNGKHNGYIRLVVTRGKGDLGLNPDNCTDETVIIIVDDISLYPAEYYEKGIAVITAATRRIGADALDPGIKSMNYLNNILAKIEAKQAGCMEAIMLNREGFVAECTADNIFIAKGGSLATPHSSCGVLRGITRDSVIRLARDMGIPCAETRLTRFDLYGADECFITGTGAEIMPVVRIDGRTVGRGAPGPLTRRLTAAFRELVYRETAGPAVSTG